MEAKKLDSVVPLQGEGSQVPMVSRGGPKGQVGKHREGGSITYLPSDTPEPSTEKTRATLI